MKQFATGSIVVLFKNRVLASEFLSRYGAISTAFASVSGGSLGSATPTGQLGYNITFRAECDRNEVLPYFRIAYLKQAPQSGGNRVGDGRRIAEVGLTFPDSPGSVTKPNDLLVSSHPEYVASLAGGVGSRPSAAGALGESTTGTIAASGPALAYCDYTISKDVVDAVTRCQLFAHGASLSTLKGKGVDITDPAVYQSQAYFDNYISSLTNLDLNVKSASSNQVNQNDYSGSVDVGQILQDILSLYLPAETLTNYEKLTALLKGSSDSKVNGFMDFWWKHTSQSQSESALAIGPIFLDTNKVPNFTVVYYSFKYSFSDWRTLWFKNTSSSVSVFSSAITLEVDLDLLNDTSSGDSVLKQISDKLAGNVKKYISSTDVSF